MAREELACNEHCMVFIVFIKHLLPHSFGKWMSHHPFFLRLICGKEDAESERCVALAPQVHE
jgi:hypothetical protein